MPGKAWSSRWIDAQVLKHAARSSNSPDAEGASLCTAPCHRTRSVKLTRTIATGGIAVECRSRLKLMLG